jgi:hypothetical protein
MLKQFFRYVCWLNYLLFCYVNKEKIFDDSLIELLFDICSTLVFSDNIIEAFLFGNLILFLIVWFIIKNYY